MQIFEYIRGQRNDFETKEIPVVEGVDHSLFKTINHIDHYWADKYLQDDASDDIIGDYPFDNISKFRVLLEARATDFDSKHVEVEPERPDRESRVKTMIATKAIRRWMRKHDFGKTINDICITRPKYGGVLVSKTKEGIVVDPWQNLIVDQSNIMAGTRIKRHYLTPSEMVKMRGTWKNIDRALETAQEERDKDSKGSASETAETQGYLIEVFEVQGDLEQPMLEEAIAIMNDEDYEDKSKQLEFVEGRVIVCGIDWKGENKEEKGIVLYARKEKSQQKYLARNPQAGRALGVGIVEDLFEHQKWHNFTKTEEMRMMAIAGKKLYWTDDPDILANIFDEGVDHGTVLRVGNQKTLGELNQLPTGMPVYQSMRQELDASADKVTNSYSSKLGDEAKSGTPFRAQYLQNLEASSQFEQYREEIGFFLTEIVEDFILEDALKELADAGELYDTFSPQELMLIDEVIIESKVTEEFVRRTLAREVITPGTLDEIRSELQTKLRREGSKRLIEDIKDFVKDAGGSVVIHMTDEALNKVVYFESLGNALTLFAPEDPRRNAIINRIMDAIGISKEELELYNEDGVLAASNPKLENEQINKASQIGPSLSLA